MATQWHPVFVKLLGLLLNDFYEIQPEISVSDLPRRADLLVIRRQATEQPPFEGLWTHLNDWNVMEFKGPTDRAEEDDLDLLMHVGAGITYRFNQERQTREEPRLANRQISLWFLAPSLGDTFLDQARVRLDLYYETGGLWRGKAWGHPVWLLSYRDAPVEEDTIPLHLFDREPGAPIALGKLMLKDEELLRRFTGWVLALQPDLWEEMRRMSTTTSQSVIDWEAVSKVYNLEDIVPYIPPEKIIQRLGVKEAIKVIGRDAVIKTLGEKELLVELLGRFPKKEVEEILRQQPPEDGQSVQPS
jgi:hypothetical protein